MSAIAAIYNVPGHRDDLFSWSFAHAAHHRDIIRRIYELTSTRLDEFVLDPFNPNDTGVWLYQHQQMHQQMDGILGISGYNLLEANFKDQNELAGWIWLNADEHYQASNILGLG